MDAQSLDVPRGGVPSLTGLFHFDTMLPVGLGVIGDILWMIAYCMAVIIGFRRQTYGLPILAVCLNITWEFVYTVIHTPDSRLTLGLHAMWLAIDVIILYQIFRFGARTIEHALIKRHFHLLLSGLIGLSLAFHLTWHDTQTAMAIFPDEQGVTAAYIINLIMSILFVVWALNQPDHPGLSLRVAWTKLAGTTVISIANTIAYFSSTAETFEVQVRLLNTQEWRPAGTVGGQNFNPDFMFYLFLTILLFDIFYVWLLSRQRKAGSMAAIANTA